jgi:uncharacterized membrane protein YdbT with pleckstrin-like domain
VTYDSPQRDMTPAHIRRLLDPAEVVVAARRLHPALLALPIVIAVGGLVVAFAVDTLTSPKDGGARTVVWVLWAVALIYSLYQFALWWNDLLVITNKRIISARGLITRDVDTLPLAKLTDMKYTRTIWGRLLGYGNFDVQSAASDQRLRHISFVPDSDQIYQQISHELFGGG